MNLGLDSHHTGRGAGASVSREGGASTSTQPIRPVQMERPSVQPRVFAMTQQEATLSPDVIFGRLTIFGESAYVLINPGATHSFIVSSFTFCIPWEKSVMNQGLIIDMPVGESVVCRHVYRGCELELGGQKLGRFSTITITDV